MNEYIRRVREEKKSIVLYEDKLRPKGEREKAAQKIIQYKFD